MDAKTDDKSAGKCPFTDTRGHTNRDWWPKTLDVGVLHRNSDLSDPMGEAFNYAKEFKTLDLKSLIKDWLDQNLPYMIERIVKKEIEKMVNRAEKL